MNKSQESAFSKFQFSKFTEANRLGPHVDGPPTPLSLHIELPKVRKYLVHTSHWKRTA